MVLICCAWEEELSMINADCVLALRAEICPWLLLSSPLSLWVVKTATAAKVLPLAMVLRIFKAAL